MTQRSRASRPDAAARERSRTRSSTWLPIAAVAVLVVAAAAAFLLSQGSTGGSSTRPSASAGSSPVAGGGGPAISGASLPLFENPRDDTAVGTRIPAVTAPGGTIALDGRPKVLLFLAHWCPHCQAEVPLVQGWVDGGGLPDDVDLISVSTAIDPSRPNHPPQEWFAREGWTAPVITDPAGSVADAYGLAAFPYWVFVHADGTVAARAAGELPIATLEEVVAGLQR